MQYQFIHDNAGRCDVAELCECFGLQRSGYYAWAGREASARAVADASLKGRIGALHREARGRYGHRPIHQHLREEGRVCGRDRARRLMAELGLAGVQQTRFKPLATNSKHTFGYHHNLLKNRPVPTRCDEVWVADTTYLRVHGGWCYLATVMDLFSRRIVGWSVSKNNDAALCCEAIRSAIGTRGGRVRKGLIHHSDRGSTYASAAYQGLLEAHRICPSMSRKANCYDNAAMESFFGRYKTSNVRQTIFADVSEARQNAFEYIEIHYNRFRKHSSIGYHNPVQFEENHRKISPPPAGGGEHRTPRAPQKTCHSNN